MTNTMRQALTAALSWHIDAGADDAWLDMPEDRTKMPVPPAQAAPAAASSQPDMAFLGAAESRADSLARALAATTMDELRTAIAGFDGLSLTRTASRMVFADGRADAPIMVIGDAPDNDDDRAGTPFAATGAAGQMLDRAFAAINLSRAADDAAHGLYLTNLVNWRPPGRRSPSAAEIEVCLPFIERHIQLARPRLLVFLGLDAARALLGRGESLSKLRGQWSDYTPRTAEFQNGASPIPAIVTHPPEVLCKTPALKRAAWADLLALQDRAQTMGLLE